jgi:hypothetical protein
VILLDVPGNLIAVGGQTLALVRLSQPAPTGGVTVTVTSDSTQYVTVASPGTVAFAAGDTLQSIALTGVGLGVSILHATAAGYTAGITGVVVTTNQILLQAPFSMLAGQSTSLSIQLFPAAPAGGATVTLESTDTTILRVTTPSVTIAAGQATGSATVQALTPGVAVVTAFSTLYAPGATAVTVILGVNGLTVVMPARAATPPPAATTVVSVPTATPAAAPGATPPAPPRRP